MFDAHPSSPFLHIYYTHNTQKKKKSKSKKTPKVESEYDDDEESEYSRSEEGGSYEGTMDEYSEYSEEE